MRSEAQGPSRRRGRRAASVPPEAAARIIDGYRAGKSLEALAAASPPLSSGQVRRLLARENVPIRGRGRPAAPRPHDAPVRRLHAAGLPPASIAGQLGIPPGEVTAVLRAAGLRAHRGRPLPSPDALLAARARVTSVRALARQLRADEKRIREALAEAGRSGPAAAAGNGAGARQEGADSHVTAST